EVRGVAGWTARGALVLLRLATEPPAVQPTRRRRYVQRGAQPMLIRRVTIAILLIAASAAAASFPPINYRHRTLANGLEVYSIEDHATPTVAINVWYRVGSKNDPEGRSGFAHLFEHIMFKATAHMKSEMLDRLTE